MLSWGRFRRALQPVVLKYWLKRRSEKSVKTRVQGLELEIFPGVFHPRYFGSSSILASFVSSIPVRGKSFLEIGCGSGLIALVAAREGAFVTAVDINPEAVRCTMANAAKNRLAIDARVGDIFSAVHGMRFDVIAWNPPFLRGVARSLPEAAFYGGHNFDVIRKFVAEVRGYLKPGAPTYTILSTDIPVRQIEQLFQDAGFEISVAYSSRWKLGETMVILCAR